MGITGAETALQSYLQVDTRALTLCINQTQDIGCPGAVIVTLDEMGPFDREQFQERDVAIRYQQLTLQCFGSDKSI